MRGGTINRHRSQTGGMPKMIENKNADTAKTDKQIKLEEELFNYQGQDEVISSLEMKLHLKESSKEFKKYHSNFPTLDDAIGGFEPGELTVISGITGCGKTLFCQTLTKHFVEQRTFPLWFSFEVTPTQFLNNFGKELPLFYTPKTLKGMSTKWIWRKIYEAKIKYGIDTVFIDHLHFLVPFVGGNMSLAIGQTMRTLKKIALEFDLVFFLIAHTKKTNPDDELALGCARDSSFVEQEADNVFYIWRRTDDPQKSVLKIAKNRRRGVMNKKIQLFKRGDFLEENSDEY